MIFMQKGKKVVVLDELDTAPLLSLNTAGRSRGLAVSNSSSIPFQHLFRPIDLPKLDRVNIFLQDAGLETYLAGNVLTYPIFKGGDKKYSDIDLIAVGPKRIVDDLKHNFDSEAFHGLDYTVQARIDGESLNFKVQFTLDKAKPTGGYVPVSRDVPLQDGRYTIRVVKPRGSSVAPIDLTLLTLSQFRSGNLRMSRA